MTRLWPSLLGAAKIVQPETILRWHRAGFKAFWRWKSRKKARASELRFESTIRVDHYPDNVPDFQTDPRAKTYPFVYDPEEMPDLMASIARGYPDSERRDRPLGAQVPASGATDAYGKAPDDAHPTPSRRASPIRGAPKTARQSRLRR